MQPLRVDQQDERSREDMARTLLGQLLARRDGADAGEEEGGCRWEASDEGYEEGGTEHGNHVLRSNADGSAPGEPFVRRYNFAGDYSFAISV